MTVRAFQVPALVAALVAAGSAFSQVPVIDSATLTQATQTAQNTAQIMNTNQQILTTVNQTLSAVTGTRTTSPLSSLGLGSGFSMSACRDSVPCSAVAACRWLVSVSTVRSPHRSSTASIS